MSTLDLTSSFGLELVGKRALKALRANLNAELAIQETRWATLDAELSYRTVQLERVKPENFYHGHRPSLIEAPAERYPNCSVMAYQARPTGEQLDEYNAHQLMLYIELMCKSDHDEGEANSRIQRTVDAAHAVMLGDSTLGGTVFEMGHNPEVMITDIFVRPETRGHGGRFLWAGGRLDYRIVKYGIAI